MEPLRQSIQTLFLRQNPLQLIEKLLDNSVKYPAEQPARQDFKLSYREDFPTFTLDQIETVFNVLTNDWMKEDADQTDLFFFPGSSVFNPLLHYAQFTLIEEDSKPVCHYERLLGWHDLTQKVSEDLITIAFLAAKDAQRGVSRYQFEWPSVVEHDNAILRNILNRKDVAELHAHLKGSSLTFELNWIELMNHIEGREDLFKKYQKYQKSEYTFDSHNSGSLYDNIKVAAAIRLQLFEEIISFSTSTKTPNDVERILNDILDSALVNSSDPIQVKELQSAIDASSLTYGNSYSINEKDVNVDYAITKGSEETPLSVIAGERQLIYKAFRMLLKNGNQELQMRLYLYLVIKLKFRSEMIQTNKFVGFDNFAQYEGRKSTFLDDAKELIVPTLATRSFFDKNAPHRYFEARLVPKPEPIKLIGSIEDTEYSIQHLFKDKFDILKNPKEDLNARNYQCFYIMHFIKQEEKDLKYMVPMECRHVKERDLYKKQAESIYEFRQHSMLRPLIVGIDAANSEIFCRPEVFAQEFRYLRHQSIESGILDNLGIPRPQQLRITYHVGEDFMDIIDGLRAVDEAIHFIGLTNGDRIGHGLVLGTDPDAYYHDRSMMLTLKRHEWLDNIVWMYQACCKFDCSIGIIQRLKQWYGKYYREIYPDKIDDIQGIANIDDFYQAWALRGDNPGIYNNEEVNSNEYPLDAWIKENKNDDPSAKDARNNEAAKSLYKAYHFDKNVRKKGDESISVKITDEYIEAVKIIQKKMLDEIQRLHIAIECNPTSNYRIGEFTRYAAHPLVKFFNYGLVTDYDPHSISISINTDDSGVFATSIEREYSLIALALEKDKEISKQNPPRAIYDWLDKIREMSQEQRFYK